MVYRLTFSYRGTEYAGWQRQPNAPTVQEAAERGIARLLDEPVPLVAASRTDAGVHARGQETHLELERDFPLRGLVHGTNRFLPEDIRVTAACRMPDGFHARKHAASKLYRYRLIRAPVLSPLDAPFAVRVGRRLDLTAMHGATEALVGEHDFSAFALAGGAHRQPRRRILTAAWREEGDELRFEIEGTGFLRGMVRALVGTLLEVGRRRRPTEDLGRLLQGAARGEAGPTAPARGLTLERVRYPERWRPLC